MHRSSESIAALAAALAKAQSELSNPEKSLVATIGGERPGEGTRSFRYAPLSSGLDIVRKALGRQQIAIVQTTAIDASTGTVNLTTVLAHASGEWIASDWPVCRLADTAAPHRMGAALTYARRYALFTLVGIAGEDDLDAPDLNCRPQSRETTLASIKASDPNKVRPPAGSGRTILGPDVSAALRDRLVREVARLGSAVEAGQWARTALPAKNTLTASDARLVEVAFGLRVSIFENEEALRGAGPAGSLAMAERAVPSSGPPGPRSAVVGPRSWNGEGAKAPKLAGIDKSVLAIGEPRRYRDRAHLEFVASQSCLICGRRPCDPHHLGFTQKRALGRKVSDEFTVPLCRLHHRELHRSRNERAWWSRAGIDAIKIARTLWKKTRAAGSKASTETTVDVADTLIQGGELPQAAKEARPADKPTAMSDAP
jgi:hypothetical protein